MLAWTADKRTELGSLWLAGLGSAEVAQRMGATLTSVRTRAWRMGLPDAKTLRREGIVGTIRDCMCCRLPFYSEGRHNRLCFECKDGEQD